MKTPSLCRSSGTLSPSKGGLWLFVCFVYFVVPPPSALAAAATRASQHTTIDTLFPSGQQGAITAANLRSGLKTIVDSAYNELDDGTAIDTTALGAFAADPSTNGSFSASAWRTDLGLVIGTNVQAWNTQLDAIAALTTTAFGRGLLAETNAASLKTTLSLNNVENTALSTWAGSSNITTLGTISTGVWNGTAITNISESIVPTWTGLHSFSITSTATSGSVRGMIIAPTYNQASGTAQNTDLLINRTQTAVGSGAQYLIDAQVGGGSKFSITNTGNVSTAGTITTSTTFITGATTIGSGYIRGDGATFEIGFASSSGEAYRFLSATTQAQTSGTYNAVSIVPTYNQASGTAANTDLLINRTQTAVGSGAQYLIDSQVGGVSKFSVTNGGRLTFNDFVVSSGSVDASILWSGGGRIYPRGDSAGVVLTNVNATDTAVFLQLGGTSASATFPALKRIGTTIAFRLGDDSADGALTADTIALGGGAAFKLTAVNSVSPTAPDRTLTITYAGTPYYIAAKTTND